jgi:hypothetical protein
MSYTDRPSTSACNTTKDANRRCACITLDRDRLNQALQQQLGPNDQEVLQSPAWQQAFASSTVFVPKGDLMQMQKVVHAIEAAAALPEYQQQVMSWAPATASRAPGPVGAFMGYDFHLTDQGPQLIEINTNAGGAFVNALLGRAQRRCCPELTEEPSWLHDFEASVEAMFEQEWRLQRGSGRPACIAIVDNEPEKQYLYPEFRLVQSLLEARGYTVLVLDPAELSYADSTLYNKSQPVDLVYNRLVDFGFEEPQHAHLRAAWEQGATVITPNPHNHALLADKRNLTVLSDTAQLQQWGLSRDHLSTLETGVPSTRFVSPGEAEELWHARRNLFFKPASGHGSKGVYRGNKITKSVFARILDDDYIAQTFVSPSERLVRVDGEDRHLKVDVRLYTYAGNTLMVAARLYQGQATNFRTPGGGFAPVLGLAG